jgi:hypothetical protein
MLVAFDKHTSSKLVGAFKGYQGQEPRSAQYIFMGLDANFSAKIEDSPIFPEVLKYLSDGVGYWKETKQHHPFLSPLYKKGSGHQYHHNFSKIGLTSEYADKVSFVELLECPTCGKTKYKRFRELLDEDYLSRLDSLLSTADREKDVFIARGVYARLFKIGKAFSCFKWLPEPRTFDLNQLYTMDISPVLRVHVITHFSDSISDRHISAIKEVILADW